jgi:phenylacetic acid degradation protein PaaD
MSDGLKIARACADRMYTNDDASKALGISIDILEPGSALASMIVRDDMTNGFDICHGGLIFALADTAFAFACNSYDDVTVAASCTIEFIRPAKVGDRLYAEAREEHRGRKSGIYAVEIQNQDDECIALFRGRSKARGQRLLGD